MSHENPTLKIRVALDGRPGEHWGQSCDVLAAKIVGDAGRVLDAKWGREPQKWHDDGRGWGRVRLTERERGFVEARQLSAEPEGVEARLLAIIERLTT